MDKVTLYAPIEKADEEQRMVYGYASTEALDSQGEIVNKGAIEKALSDYMKFANIREMHQPSAVGKTKKAQIDKKGLYIAAKVVDSNAWQKVKEGVYNGFSIGGRVMQMVDNEITDLKLSEISLVDRPANPEAVFDVYKLEDGKGAVKEEVEVKKDMYGADYLVDLACGLASFISSEKAQGEDSSKLESALKAIKTAIVTELKEDEFYDQDTQDMFAYAEQVLDLKKEDDAEVIEEEKDIEPATETVVEDAQPTEEPKEEVKEEAEPAQNTEEAEEPKEEAAEEAPAEEAVTEEPKEAAEKTPMEKVAELIMQAKMPDDKLIAEMLKSQEVEVTDKAIDAARWELAGKVLKIVSKSVADVEDAEAIKQAAEKAVEKQEKPTEEVKHQWDEVKLAINKFGKVFKEEMEKSTSSEVAVPPQAPVSPVAANEQTSEALRLLQEAVNILSATGIGGQLTPSEEDKEVNGANAGSTQSSSGNAKAEEVKDLSKFEGEIAALKEQIEKLSNTPEPVKVKTSYTVVEKFEANDKKAELEKMKERANELHDLMKSEPQNQAYIKEAQELAPQIQKLQREVQ